MSRWAGEPWDVLGCYGGQAAALDDPVARGEIQVLLRCDEEHPSRTWRAKAWVQRVGTLPRMADDAAVRTYQTLLNQGIESELEHFYEVLETVKDFIRQASLDEEELAEIHEERERGANMVRQWIDERRRQLVGRVDGQALVLLAFSDLVPPPVPVAPIHWLAQFRHAPSN